MDDKTSKFLNSVTEHPDVQRLIKQVIRGDAKNKQLQAKNERLKKELKYIKEQMDCPAIQCEGDWQTGMFCGLEDRNITDRYDACMYGYNHAIERVKEWALCGINQALRTEQVK